MEPDVMRLAFVLATLAGFGTVVTAVGVVAYRIISRSPNRSSEADGPPVVSEARFARLEQAIDVIAVEVERIAEAQRFSAQLMAEQVDRLPAARSDEREQGRQRPESTSSK